MQVHCVTLGLYETNCYVVRNDVAARQCVIIDAALQGDGLVDFVQDKSLEPVAVVLTHGHADHISGLAAVRGTWKGIKVYLHEQDARLLTDPAANLSMMTGAGFTAEPAECLIKDGDIIDEAKMKFEVIHTPGHTPGGVCLYARAEGILFAGDTLFAGSVGRTDFPGGSMTTLSESIKNRLFCLSDETIVRPGHGPETTIGQEKRYNPFLK